MKRYGPLAVLLAVVPLLAFGPGERIAPTHWALIVGITDYIHFDDVEGGDLPGAQYDAMAVRDVLLQKYGFPEDNIRLLLNHDATRAAIEEGVTGWLSDNTRPGDNIVVYFAGHGSQVWDLDGDEDDGLDETIAPADVLPDSPELDITDDDFGAWLRALPTGNVIVILDSCHSGTATRDVTPFSRARKLGRDVNTLEQPAGMARRALPGQIDATGFNAGGAQVLELAAAQPHQAAVDAFFPGESGSEPFHGGAFTTYLVRQLWQAPRDATYERVFGDVREALRRNRFQQDPHLSEDVGLKALSLFFVEGGAAAAGDAALPVTSTSGNTAELGGGQTLGITSGSVFSTESGATLTIESVTQGSSTARVSGGSVRPGDRARLTGYRYPLTPLRVNLAGLDTESSDAIAGAVRGNAGIQIYDQEGAFSHVLVRRRGNELRILGADGFVRHDGLPVAAEAARLGEILSAESAAKQLADMENPAQPFGVEIRLAGGGTSFGIGEEISFHARSDREGYLTLVDLGTDGTVAVLLPNAQAPSLPIQAGQEISFPAADAGFALQALPPAGRGMVRAFVTDRPLDIRIPADEEYATGGTELAAWITEQVRAAAGEVGGAVRLDSWATASLVYDIHN